MNHASKKINSNVDLKIEKCCFTSEQGTFWSFFKLSTKNSIYNFYRAVEIYYYLNLLEVSVKSLVQKHLALWTIFIYESDIPSRKIVIELKLFYKAKICNVESNLKELMSQNFDFIVWQKHKINSCLFNRQLTFWHEKLLVLQGFLEIPLDKSRAKVQVLAGNKSKFTIDENVLNQIILSTKNDFISFNTLFATIQILLFHVSNQSDFCKLITSANRTNEEIKSLFRIFVFIVIIRANLNSNMSFLKLTKKEKEYIISTFSKSTVFLINHYLRSKIKSF